MAGDECITHAHGLLAAATAPGPHSIPRRSAHGHQTADENIAAIVTRTFEVLWPRLGPSHSAWMLQPGHMRGRRRLGWPSSTSTPTKWLPACDNSHSCLQPPAHHPADLCMPCQQRAPLRTAPGSACAHCGHPMSSAPVLCRLLPATASAGGRVWPLLAPRCMRMQRSSSVIKSTKRHQQRSTKRTHTSH